jgi:putative transcriptional regulator
MKKTLGEELIEGVKQAIEYQKGNLKARTKLVTLDGVKPAPTYKKAKIVQIRSKLGLGQSGFAKLLCVSTRTVQSWEQGLRTPNKSINRLLEIIEKKPKTVFEILVS